MKIRIRLASLAFFLALLFPAALCSADTPVYFAPDPGSARAEVNREGFSLENSVLRVRWNATGEGVEGLDFTDLITRRTSSAQRQPFTLLLGAEPEISAKYFVEAYPTVFVVDRQGRIKFRELGGGSPDQLRAAVEAALNAK